MSYVKRFDFGLFYKYLEAQQPLHCIPVNGKVPLIEDWNKQIDLDEEILQSWEETLADKCTGMGFCAGQHNIGYLDIDTDDELLIYKIDEVLDLSQVCVKKGKKGKTVFFRFEGTPKKSKYNIYLNSSDRKPICEINFTTGHTVLPPSIHPDTRVPYTWIGHKELWEVDLDDLTVIKEERIEYLETILRAPSLKEGLKNVPTGITGEGSGKFNTMKAIAISLLNTTADDHNIIKTLIFKDSQLFKGNEFFLSEKLGKDKVSNTNVIMNATMWLSTLKNSVMRTHETILNAQMSKVFTDKETLKDLSWPTVVPLYRLKEQAKFPWHIVPPILDEYMEVHSRLSGLPKESFFLPILSTFSAAAQGRIKIDVKWDLKLRVGIHCVVVAPSGSRKDSVLAAARALLFKVIEQRKEKLGEGFIEDEKITIEKINEVDRKIKQAIKENDDELIKSLKEEKIKLQNELVDLKKKSFNMIFESGTVEKMAQMAFMAQDRGLFYNIGEAVQFLGTMKKTGNESMKGLVLKVLNGAEDSHSHQTLNGLNVFIKEVFGVILMGIQDDIFNKAMEADMSGQDGSGFWQRFFIVNINSNPVPMQMERPNIDMSKLENLYHLVFNLEHLHWVTFADKEAEQLYVDFDQALRLKAHNQNVITIKSFQSKFSANMIRIAWLLGQLRSPGVIVTKITVQMIKDAIDFINYQDVQTLASFSNMKSAYAYNDAVSILDLREAYPTGSKLKSLLMATKISPSRQRAALALLEQTFHIVIDNGNLIWNPSL